MGDVTCFKPLVRFISTASGSVKRSGYSFKVALPQGCTLFTVKPSILKRLKTTVLTNVVAYA